MNLDMNKLEPLLGTVVNELGAASNAALVIVGDKLGLFRTLAGGPMTSAELAERTGTHERYVREWLSAQAASGFVAYDAMRMSPSSLKPSRQAGGSAGAITAIASSAVSSASSGRATGRASSPSGCRPSTVSSTS